jgi:hypothetical protein
VTRAPEAIGDLPIRRAVPTLLAADEPRNPRASGRPACCWTVTGAVGSLGYAECVISDRLVACWIRPGPAVVIAPVAVAPSAA